MPTASTTTGSTIGISRNTCKIDLPRKVPRVIASADQKPRTTEQTATRSPTLALASTDWIHCGLAKNSQYHFSVQAGGGKISQRDEPKDSRTMKTIGSSRKTQAS